MTIYIHLHTIAQTLCVLCLSERKLWLPRRCSSSCLASIVFFFAFVACKPPPYLCSFVDILNWAIRVTQLLVVELVVVCVLE